MREDQSRPGSTLNNIKSFNEGILTQNSIFMKRNVDYMTPLERPNTNLLINYGNDHFKIKP